MSAGRGREKWSEKVRFAGKSDKGLSRRNNEDAYCIVDLRDSLGVVVAAVADGMGGHRAGNIASKMAIEQIQNSLEEEPINTESFQAIKDRLKDILEVANNAVFDKSLTDPKCGGMGTTLTIAVIGKDSVVFAHVGDSCAFYLSGGEMNKVTTDHTYVEELVRLGSITREEAMTHPQRNYITKAVGCFDDVSADYYSVKLIPGDRVLLCSDGLNKMLSDSEIAKIVYDSDNPEGICAVLIDQANIKGGLDNITAVVFLNLDEVESNG